VTLAFPVSAVEPEVKIGAAVEKLNFKDIRYSTRTIDDLPKSKACVLVFTNTTCPLVRRYLPALNKLEKSYRTMAVQFVGVNVGPEDSIREMAAHAVAHDVEFPVVKDQWSGTAFSDSAPVQSSKGSRTGTRGAAARA
jgi:hypothetical protein